MSLLEIHVLLSFAEMAAGIAVVYGLLMGRAYGGWTVLFFVTAILTDLTGFPLPPFGFDPPRAVGLISLLLLAVALIAYYGFRLSGLWRPVYVVTALMAFYLDVFVGVIQAFLKIPALHDLAPTPVGAAVCDRANRRLGDFRRDRLCFAPQISPGAGGAS